MLTGEKKQTRDHVLAGVWGREVHLVDGETKYARAPEKENFPLSMWSNRWSSMPVHHAMPEYDFPTPDERAWLDNMPGSKIPVIRQPFREGDLLPLLGATAASTATTSTTSRTTRARTRIAPAKSRERENADRLREALKAVDAPDDQFERLGLA